MEASSQAGSRPTAWIAATAVLALTTIGLGIWAFTTQSDLDDANATIDSQKKRLASTQQTAQAEEGRLEAFGRRERVAYRRVRHRLIRKDAAAAELRKRVQDEAANLDQARTEVTNAEGKDRKEAARLKVEQAKSRLATACSASSVDALQRFFDAANVREGARKAVAQLEATQQECQNASEES
jgi:hypothetical protein